jgi:hypothetical protein
MPPCGVAAVAAFAGSLPERRQRDLRPLAPSFSPIKSGVEVLGDFEDLHVDRVAITRVIERALGDDLSGVV